MKLATLRTNSRDGLLLVVSRDLTLAVAATQIAPNLQSALESWTRAGPRLASLYASLNERRAADSFAFDPARCAAPLPRAYQWLHSASYAGHVALLTQLRPDAAAGLLTEPRLGQCRSDSILGPRDPVRVPSEEWGIDFGAELALVTDDVPAQVARNDAQKHIRLFSLACSIHLQGFLAGELASGLGMCQSKPCNAMAPVVVTADEFGAAYKDGRLLLPVELRLNGQRFGVCEAGSDMSFDFAHLLAQAAFARPLGAGTIISTGPISNLSPRLGPAGLADKRQREMSEQGRAATPFLRFGDRLGMEILDRSGASVFGAIEQEFQRSRRDT